MGFLENAPSERPISGKRKTPKPIETTCLRVDGADSRIRTGDLILTNSISIDFSCRLVSSNNTAQPLLSTAERFFYSSRVVSFYPVFVVGFWWSGGVLVGFLSFTTGSLQSIPDNLTGSADTFFICMSIHPHCR